MSDLRLLAKPMPTGLQVLRVPQRSTLSSCYYAFWFTGLRVAQRGTLSRCYSCTMPSGLQVLRVPQRGTLSRCYYVY